MRNANAQRAVIIVRPNAMRQAGQPHVSHAQNQARNQYRKQQKNQEGQRCALLTTKSRNTCTRATVFSSSG